jgi:hypothetical protein
MLTYVPLLSGNKATSNDLLKQKCYKSLVLILFDFYDFRRFYSIYTKHQDLGITIKVYDNGKQLTMPHHSGMYIINYSSQLVVNVPFVRHVFLSHGTLKSNLFSLFITSRYKLEYQSV